ncbi:MAG: 3-methyl-2-oxobutanoate hydroxymethyltransferase [Acidobacteriota bacterium]|nr:3-methyl-2-oxobutanoate hydroxymethyltransferase [Acidobacteriota bacterium]MDH3525770.1 3-methyl-2-oxobutanoate hydroxymethyltransferase [Acidobacteriota bacterium]
MKTVRDFARFRAAGRRISMVTCYDAWSARIIQASRIDCILVGDSAAMVMHGHDSTIPATVEMMAAHVAAVRRGAPDKLTIGDFPFLAHRQGVAHAVAVAERLMKAGAQAVKIEGVRGHEDAIGALVEGGVPVMGHLGLTPQSVHQLGGFKVQARGEAAAARLLADARTLAELGAFGLVLEAVPSEIARAVTDEIEIPTIGIGAGPHTSGQVLVLHDLLGCDETFRPRFVRRYLEGHALVRRALDRYAEDVENNEFPSTEESYHDTTDSHGRRVAAPAR